MSQVNKLLRQCSRFVLPGGLILLAAVITVLIVFEAYVLVIKHFADKTPLPSNFGNHPDNIKKLTDQPQKDIFRFAVAGDTKSVGTFEGLAEKLRREQIDFAVLLGDVSFNGTEAYHRHLRAEIKEYALLVPTFYIVGNHDVEPDTFPARRFEEIYGPSIFSFVYQDCLFIALRILEEPHSNQDSLDFLSRLVSQPNAAFRKKFVFLHIPPVISPDFSVRAIKDQEALLALLDKLQVDYVFAGDFHGYARVQRGRTTYLVTGGGGARLKETKFKQFHHAVVMTVGKDFLSERILQVDKRIDLEDALEKLAIGDVYPWLLKYRLLVIPLNAVLLGIFFGLVYVLRKRVRPATI